MRRRFQFLMDLQVFVEAIRAAGIKEQSEPRQFIKVEKKIEIKEGINLFL